MTSRKHTLPVGLLKRLRSGAWARVGKNALALLVGQAGVRALNLVLIALVTRALGVEGLGRYLMAMTVQTIALAVSDLGLNTFTVREFSREDGMAGGGLWTRVLVLKLAGALGAIAVLNVVVAPFFAGRRILVAIVSLSLLPDTFSGLAAARIKAQQRMEVSAGITLGARLAYSLVGGVLLWRGYDERVLLGAYAAVSLLGAMIFGLVLRRGRRARAGERGFSSGPCPYAGWRGVLGESTPFAITGMVSMVYARADLLVLSFTRGDAVAGRYGMAYRLWEAMGMIPASFLDALFPELSRLGDQSLNRDRLRVLYRRGWQIVGVGAVLVSVVTQIAATPLIALFFGRTSDADLAVGILRLLLLAFPFTYLYLLNGHTLYAIGQQRRVTVAMVGVVAVKLLMDALIVPRWSTLGAASVALASEALLFAWLQFLVWRSVQRAHKARGRDGLAPTDVSKRRGGLDDG